MASTAFFINTRALFSSNIVMTAFTSTKVWWACRCVSTWYFHGSMNGSPPPCV